jgi:hypothetical protein
VIGFSYAIVAIVFSGANVATGRCRTGSRGDGRGCGGD